MIIRVEPEYIDGIKELHTQLDFACKDAYQMSKKYILFSKATSDMVLNQHIFKIFVDFSEEQPENAVKGYFVFGHNIIRFASVVLDYAVLFPVCNHSGGDDKENREGITYAEILEMKRNRNKVFIKFSPKEDSRIKEPLYVAEYRIHTRASARLDDIGKPFIVFDDVKSLKICNIPEQLTTNKYTLAGKQYYAPYSTSKEMYCALFAQTNNEYDENAIKVLRWFPISRAEAAKERQEIEEAKEKLQRQEKNYLRMLKMTRSNDQYDAYLQRPESFIRPVNESIYLRKKKMTRSNDQFDAYLQRSKAVIQELKESIANANSHGNMFFELGYIARTDNSELHKFMIENSSRLLFGKIENDKISLLGGIKIFFDNDFNFPASLIKIPIA